MFHPFNCHYFLPMTVSEAPKVKAYDSKTKLNKTDLFLKRRHHLEASQPPHPCCNNFQ